MEKLRRFITSFLPALLLLTLLAGYSNAALLDVGPTVPEVIPSTPPQHGYPLWYRDQNRMPLEICLSNAPSPNAPGSNMCNLLPEGPAAALIFDPAQPVVFPTNFPNESFWWATEATIKNGFVRALLVMALEGAWNTGEIASGQQVTFMRLRIMVDTPVAGTYRIVFPFGERTFVNVPAGVHAIFHTEDIGLELGKFDGALQGGAGPFLRWDSGIPIVVNGESFIGDPNVQHTITGSPLGTNFFRIEGPVGSNLDGLGSNVVQQNLFAVTGKLYQGAIPTPVKVDKAVYGRNATGAQVSVFSTSQPVANTTNPFAPFPGNYALLGTPSALQLAGAGIPTTNLVTNQPADGKFFGATVLFPDPGTLPATVTVTNTADDIPVPVAAPLVDEVTVSEATYLPLTKTLTIAAASSDQVAAPALQAYLPGMAAPLGTLAAGTLVVHFPVTDSSVNPPAVFETPRPTVTVKSAAGGALTVPVLVKDQVDLPPTGSIVINSGAAYTTNPTGTLSLTATDDSGIVAQMQFSRDGIAWFPWEPFAGLRSINLAFVPGYGVKTIYVRFKDGNGNVSLSYSDTIEYIAPLQVASTSLANGAVNVAYSRTVASSGGVAPYTWSATGLPSGLAIDPATGVISGTPAATLVASNASFADFPVSVTVMGADAATANAVLNLRINQSAPAAPSLLSATAPSATQVVLNWTDNANNESVVQVQRATDAGFTTGLTSVSLSGTTLASYTDNSVASGTTYYYRVRSGNFVAWSTAFSNTATVTTPTSVLAITTTSLAAGTVNAAYSRTVAATGGTTPYTWSATGLPSGLAINPGTGVISGTPANVVASNASFADFPVSITVQGANAATANAALSLRIYQSAPAAPSGLSATAPSATRVVLNWTDSANNEVLVQVQRATDAGFTTGLTSVSLSGTTLASYTDNSVAAGTTYYYRVRSGNFVAWSTAFSNTATVTTPASVLAITTTSLANGAVNAAYSRTVAATAGTTPYTWSATGLPSGLAINPGTGVISGTPANVVASNASFADFPVSITVQGADTATANAVISLRINQSAPAAPSGLSATAPSATQVVLNWTDNANNESVVQVQRATDAGFTTGLTSVTRSGAALTTYTDNSVVSGTTYFYRVRSGNYVAWSTTFSNTISVTTP